MDIGSTIRNIRKRKNITIAQICEETGLSQGFMSQVETNKTSPSISTLDQIANALNVPLAFLLLRKDDRMSIVRKEERQMTTTGSGNLKITHLSSVGGVRMTLAELPPGASTGTEPHAHEGKEVHFVMQGSVYVEQGEDSATLSEGDSFSWHACVPHLVKNVGDGPAVVLIAIYKETDLDLEFDL
ncbi:MerR family transcriptional regulator [Paenibacillus baekrokdamisoli]|uniref:MerR family transcriptional regulator n=1 Tax=Paenibacillus baekrokdamisoli TaxID=1712516 RepID=A0A3G9JLD1_9BACL|nr:XRE family transcriptional regulator [Paenibacillus baekrokdamisoli]MBB3068877.1 transcriptional regulator with XRE-family HTH domain [Paenibacillus baekrokdamisoli]BBH23704.1 MerR family transcriptional regulator [Paenibacillus baekrokdamisoli]